MATGHETGTAWATGYSGCVKLFEQGAFRCQAIDIRRHGVWMAGGAEIAASHVIGQNEDDVRLIGSVRSMAACNQAQADSEGR